MTLFHLPLATPLLLMPYTYSTDRRPHLAACAIKDQAYNHLRDLDNLYKQIQAYSAHQRNLKFEEHLPPQRGWAASPDFLLTIQ